MKPTRNLDCKPKRLVGLQWTAEEFEFFTGHKPEKDDLARCNCPDGGKIGHENCGICIHHLPVFACSVCFPLSCGIGGEL